VSQPRDLPSPRTPPPFLRSAASEKPFPPPLFRSRSRAMRPIAVHLAHQRNDAAGQTVTYRLITSVTEQARDR
jgi:hypothetical protein